MFHVVIITDECLSVTFVLTRLNEVITCFREELFENRAAGSSLDSTKVLVLITDGDPSDPNNRIIESYDEKHIIRFVIGVGFQTSPMS